MALTDKTIATTYKDLLTLNNSNSGVTASGTTIQDGNGTNTALTLGTRNSKFQPNSDHTQVFVVDNAAGDNLLTVDTTNKLVKVNETQLAANTQYLRFSANDIDVDSGTHIGVPIAGMGANAAVTFGTGTDPTTPTLSNNLDDVVHYLHYVDVDITIDSSAILVGASAATGDIVNFHLMELVTGDTTPVDEFSAAYTIGASPAITSAGYEQFYKTAFTLDSTYTDVDSGNYIFLTIEGNGTNSDYSVNALVRYHLR